MRVPAGGEGLREHTGRQWLWCQVLSAASSFCIGSARHHSHKLCQDKANVFWSALWTPQE